MPRLRISSPYRPPTDADSDAERARLALIRQWREWLADIVRRHRITRVERDEMPRSVSAYSCAATRTITVKPIHDFYAEHVVLDLAAEELHEAGHIIDHDKHGPCLLNRGGHFAVFDRREDGVTVLRDGQCEVNAWLEALHLAPSWSRRMHRRLRTALADYQSLIRFTSEAAAAARQLASDNTYAQQIQACVDRERRLDQYAEIQRAVEAMGGPRPLTPTERRLRQQAEMTHWWAHEPKTQARRYDATR